MNKQRKTITFDQDDLVLASGLKPPEEAQFYQILINHFLKGTKIVLDNLSETVKVAILGTLPKMRKLESKYENGSCKKIDIRTKGVLCSNEGSENMRIEAKMDNPNIDNFNPYNNKLLYISKILIPVNLERACAREPLKTTDQPTERVLDELQKSDPVTFSLLFRTIKYIDDAAELKVCGKSTPKAEVLRAIKTIILRENAPTTLRELREELQAAEGIRNAAGYYATMLFNAAKRREPNIQFKTNSNFTQRDYSGFDLNSLFDNLDDIEDEKETKDENNLSSGG